jgi:hypothetical protein
MATHYVRLGSIKMAVHFMQCLKVHYKSRIPLRAGYLVFVLHSSQNEQFRGSTRVYTFCGIHGLEQLPSNEVKC